MEANGNRFDSVLGGSGTDATAAKPGNGDARRYFRMGAAVALGEMIRDGSFPNDRDMRAKLRGYLASFGINGMGDIDELGITGVYRYDFEAIYW